MNPGVKLAIFVGVLLLPFLLIFLTRANNRKKSERYKQWPYPVIALIFMTACCIYYLRLENLIRSFLDMSPVSVLYQSLSSQIVYGAELYGAYTVNIVILTAYLLLRLCCRLFSSVGDFFSRIAASKKDQKNQYDASPGPVSELFYEKDGSGNIMVRPAWLAVCKMFLYAGWVILILYIILLLFAQIPLMADFSWFPYDQVYDCLEKVYLWPAVSALLIMESMWFLDGNDEYSRDDARDKQNKKLKDELDYASLQDIFRQLFPERYAGALKLSGDSENSADQSEVSGLAELIRSRLLKRKMEVQRPVSKSILDCIAYLPKHENVLIDAHLKSDFGDALMLYMNVLLARGENLLVVCRDEETSIGIKQYIEESLGKINKFSPVWIVRTFPRSSDNSDGITEAGDCDVLVVTPEKVMDPKVVNAQKQFYNRLTTVLLIDADRLIAETSTLVMAMANYLSAVISKKIQYIGLCNGIPAELRITAEHIISPGERFETFECYCDNGINHIMLWNYEPSKPNEDLSINNFDGMENNGLMPKAQEPLFQKSMDRVYLGISIPFACTALKYGVETVNVDGKRIPVTQLERAVRTNFSDMISYFNRQMTWNKLISSISFQMDLSEKDDHSEGYLQNIIERSKKISPENPFFIVNDDSYNLPKTVRNYSRLISSRSAMVHIISKPYLFRDYFADKAGEFLKNKGRMDSFSSVYSDTPKKRAMRLFFEASSKSGLSRKRLMSQMAEYTGPNLSFRNTLKKCCELLLNGRPCESVENYFSVSAKSEFDPEKTEFVSQQWIFLKHDGIQLLNKILNEVMPGQLYINGKRFSLGIPRGNIRQYYLPGQTIIYNQTMYQIDSINAEDGLIYAGWEIDDLYSPVDYIQHRQYTVEYGTNVTCRSIPKKLGSGNTEEERADKYEVTLLENVKKISVVTPGYLSLEPVSGQIDLTSENLYRPLTNEEKQFAYREYKDKSVLSVRFTGIDSGDVDKFSITLAALMSELFKTLFPYTWPCIAVCPVLHKEVDSGDNESSGEDGDANGGNSDENRMEGALSYELFSWVYPQVKITDELKAKDSVSEILIIEDSESDTGILDSLCFDRQNPLRKIFNLICDYLEWKRKFSPRAGINIDTDYLKFGMDEYPSYLDFQIVEDMFRQMKVVYPNDVSWNDPVANSDSCYFCQKDLHIAEYKTLRNEYGKKDRRVCLDCYRRLLNKDEQLIPLVERTREYLKEKFGVTLPQKIKVKFDSADNMRKRSSSKRRLSRILGQASPGTVYVEIDTPEEYALRTLGHELTHVWQYENLKGTSPVDREGQASYVEVQYMYDIGQHQLGAKSEKNLRDRNDEYGQGFRALDEELKRRGNTNSFTYMLEKFGKKK